jgi:hypothetical protein
LKKRKKAETYRGGFEEDLRRMISFGRLRKKSMMCGGMVVVVVLTVVVEMSMVFFTQSVRITL